MLLVLSGLEEPLPLVLRLLLLLDLELDDPVEQSPPVFELVLLGEVSDNVLVLLLEVGVEYELAE